MAVIAAGAAHRVFHTDSFSSLRPDKDAVWSLSGPFFWHLRRFLQGAAFITAVAPVHKPLDMPPRSRLSRAKKLAKVSATVVFRPIPS